MESIIIIDGVLDEEVWQKAQSETDFSFPWENTTPPGTEFRAVFSDNNLFFSFRVHDDEVVLKDTIGNEEELMEEDRVELYFSPDDQMRHYYCIEIDALGRVLDYETIYHRQFNFSWDWEGLSSAGLLTDEGYIVEGMIPLSSLKSLGMPVGEEENSIHTVPGPVSSNNQWYNCRALVKLD
ncbi:MAG: carbohydrate-binding family 9-like protein [Bacteroidota bacterium]